MNMINDEKKKVTIYSVANEAGVSLATVSRVINDSSLVKEETRKKVENAILKLGYKPNAIAQGLALKKTTNIALIIPDSSFLYMGKVINGLLDVAKIYKYNIALHISSSSINEMNEIVDNVVKSRSDGVIVYNDSLNDREIGVLNSFNIPTVYIGQKMSKSDACCVYIDYQQALYELCDLYLQSGIEDIVLIEDRKNHILIDDLIEGMNRAFKKHGKEFNGYIKIPTQYHNSYDYLVDYFSSHKHEVVLALRDSQAMAVLNACSENGIKVPEDTDIICVLDSRYNGMARPTISSFMIPSYDIGALAMRVMTKMLNGDHMKQKVFKMDYTFIKKGSSKI